MISVRPVRQTCFEDLAGDRQAVCRKAGRAMLMLQVKTVSSAQPKSDGQQNLKMADPVILRNEVVLSRQMCSSQRPDNQLQHTAEAT